MSEVSYSEAKMITQDYLKYLLSQQPASWKNSPMIAFDVKTWSIPDMIAQVEMDTDVGRRYTQYHNKQIGNLITR